MYFELKKAASLGRHVARALLMTAWLSIAASPAHAKFDGAVATPSLQPLHELFGGLSIGEASLAWPVAGRYRISSTFGPRRHPIHKKRRFHYGLDIASPAGTPILSVSTGRVIFAGWRPGYGRVIEIDHGKGWVSRYAHAKKIKVKQQQLVLAGQLIGQVGRSGHATGSHLHLEIERVGQRIDPLVFWKGVATALAQ